MHREPDRSDKVCRPWSLLVGRHDPDDGAKLITGVVYTPLGIVNVYQSVPDTNEYAAISYATFVWKGRRYVRSFKPATYRGLSILAGRFARDVAAGRLRK